MSAALIVFAREPVLGQVKSRLASQSSPQRALAIYRRLLARTLRLVRPAGLPGPQLWLAIDGDPDGTGSLAASARRLDAMAVPQRGADLGARMRAAIGDALAAGANRVVLIGTDCPDMHRRDLRAAFAALRSHDLVFVPTHDGGYCLVGVRADHPALFEQRQWGHAQVLADALAQAATLGLSHVLLAEQQDIDHLADWQAWCDRRATRGLGECEHA
jgi:rSAM/selenodomain-associated transferase 1